MNVLSAGIETDSNYGPGAFSIQNNTNVFTVSCHATWVTKWLQEGINGSTANSGNYTGGPVPGANGAGLPNCTNGDQGWVQFTYQTYKSGQTSVVCVWNVDTTQQWYFYPQTWTACQNAGQPGFWTTIQIEGSVDATLHLVAVTATLPWSSEWVTVVTPDWLGLCWQSGAQCPWTQASGTILGTGNGSQAQYATGTSIQTTVFASTCGAFSAADEKLDCGTIRPFNPYAATIVSTGVTAESNNLTTSFNIFAPSCAGNSCQQTFSSQK